MENWLILTVRGKDGRIMAESTTVLAPVQVFQGNAHVITTAVKGQKFFGVTLAKEGRWKKFGKWPKAVCPKDCPHCA